jgi:hypothetical protein
MQDLAAALKRKDSLALCLIASMRLMISAVSIGSA